MKIYYDLHIHSVLSPCADDLMTPNHIVLMAKLKGPEKVHYIGSAETLPPPLSADEEERLVINLKNPVTSS